MPLNNNMELRSEEVQEVMNRIPPAIQRWGLIVTSFIVAIFFTISYYIKIPITEECKYTIIWDDSISKPILKVFIPRITIQSVLSNDSTSIRLYSDMFPEKYNNGISTVIISEQISICSDGIIETTFQFPNEIKDCFSNEKHSINGSADIVIANMTILDCLQSVFHINSFKLSTTKST